MRRGRERVSPQFRGRRARPPAELLPVCGRAADHARRRGGPCPRRRGGLEADAAVPPAPLALPPCGATSTWVVPDDEGRPVTVELTEERLRYMLAKLADWRRDRKGTLVAAPPPMPVVDAVLATPDQPLPMLRGSSDTPVFGENGTLLTDPRLPSRGEGCSIAPTRRLRGAADPRAADAGAGGRCARADLR